MNQQKLLDNLNKNMSLNEIQHYIKEVIDIRGFGNQLVEQQLLLLMEEVGELAKAIRKEATDMCIDRSKIVNYDTVESEIADVFIVLASICNNRNINLYDAIINKEKRNIKRVWENTNK